MKRDEIMQNLENLARTRGFYTWFLAELKRAQAENPDRYETLMSGLEAQNFKDVVDMVMWLET